MLEAPAEIVAASVGGRRQEAVEQVPVGLQLDAVETGCDCVHPGYGFLAEHAGFAERCAAAGVTFIGPRPETLALFGDNVAARSLARTIGVPVLDGSAGAAATAADAARAADEIGYPVMLKAAAGGGGRGMRAVTRPEDLADDVVPSDPGVLAVAAPAVARPI